MSVSIKLARTGAKNNAFYRIIAATTRSKVDGKNLEILGSYDPRHKKIEINKTKLDRWIKNGAIITKAVRNLLEPKKNIKNK